MAALTLQPFAEGNPQGSWVSRKLLRRWGGTVLPRNTTLLHRPLGSAEVGSPLLLENTSLGEVTGAAITPAGQRHTEAKLLLWLPHLVCGANRIFNVLLGCYGARGELGTETERHRS